MKTLILAAAAVVSIGTGAAWADSEAPSDGGFSRGAPARQTQPADPHLPASYSFTLQTQTHDAWLNNGLNGGGG